MHPFLLSPPSLPQLSITIIIITITIIIIIIIITITIISSGRCFVGEPGERTGPDCSKCC
jgi:hypothetical protein